MPEGKVKLFVGAMVMLNNGQTFVVDTDLGDVFDFRFGGYLLENNQCRRWWGRDGTYGICGVSPLDVLKVLNSQDDPNYAESIGSGVSAADSRTAPTGLQDNLKECWERCAYGFGPSPEELRALWSLTGFPLPSPRRRCNDCNCTGRVDGGTCPTCGSSGYLPVES